MRREVKEVKSYLDRSVEALDRISSKEQIPLKIRERAAEISQALKDQQGEVDRLMSMTVS